MKLAEFFFFFSFVLVRTRLVDFSTYPPRNTERQWRPRPDLPDNSSPRVIRNETNNWTGLDASNELEVEAVNDVCPQSCPSWTAGDGGMAVKPGEAWRP